MACYRVNFTFIFYFYRKDHKPHEQNLEVKGRGKYTLGLFVRTWHLEEWKNVYISQNFEFNTKFVSDEVHVIRDFSCEFRVRFQATLHLLILP